MPLDLLLDSVMASEEPKTPQLTEEPATLEQLNDALSVAEKRCKHLAALLVESEANEARLAQLSYALNEEIRRAERAEERQKHIDNLEYLKNVVFKVSEQRYSNTGLGRS